MPDKGVAVEKSLESFSAGFSTEAKLEALSKLGGIMTQTLQNLRFEDKDNARAYLEYMAGFVIPTLQLLEESDNIKIRVVRAYRKIVLQKPYDRYNWKDPAFVEQYKQICYLSHILKSLDLSTLNPSQKAQLLKDFEGDLFLEDIKSSMRIRG